MKLYIPFNSNDFNNVFSTLSISPRNFYYERDFGFKRATQSKLNPFEDVLVAFKKPTFISQPTDFDNGYPINLVVEIKGLTKKHRKADILFVRDTIYLFDGFEVLYRTESEKKEVESKSLKSVETKFLAYAKSRSNVLLNSENITWFDKELLQDMFEGYSDNQVTRNELKPERQLNKIFGTLIGFAIGSQRNLPDEFRKLHQLSKELKNQVSLFINRIGQPNQDQKKKAVYRILSLIQEEVETIISLDNYLLDNTEGPIDEELLSRLKSLKLQDQSIYELVIKGLLQAKLDNLPLSLKAEKAKHVLYYKISKKYPQSYVERLNKHIKGILYDVEDLINEHVDESDFDSSILEAQFEKNEILSFKASLSYDQKEAEYLKYILNFFTNEDTFSSIDELHASKKEYLGDLGIYLKEHIDEFGQSKEAKYLRDLLSSFKSLTESFDINATKLDSLKSVALLFTKGRDFMQYREFVENSSIVHNEIGYAIWGAAFGYAGLPKTLTGSIFDNIEKCEIVLQKLSEFTSKHVDSLINEIESGKLNNEIIISNDEKVQESIKADYTTVTNENETEKPDNYYSVLERLLEKVNEIPRAGSNKDFKMLLGKVFRDIEEEAKLGDLFGSPESRKNKFEERVSKSLGGINGIGKGTLEKVIKAYEEIIYNE